jgi:hypothetical protein
MKFALGLLAFILLAGSEFFAQPLTGIKTISGSYPGSTSAITALNTQGERDPKIVTRKFHLHQ